MSTQLEIPGLLAAQERRGEPNLSLFMRYPDLGPVVLAQGVNFAKMLEVVSAPVVPNTSHPLSAFEEYLKVATAKPIVGTGGRTSFFGFVIGADGEPAEVSVVWEGHRIAPGRLSLAECRYIAAPLNLRRLAEGDEATLARVYDPELTARIPADNVTVHEAGPGWILIKRTKMTPLGAPPARSRAARSPTA